MNLSSYFGRIAFHFTSKLISQWQQILKRMLSSYWLNNLRKWPSAVVLQTLDSSIDSEIGTGVRMTGWPMIIDQQKLSHFRVSNVAECIGVMPV